MATMDVSYENIVENDNCYLVNINLEPTKPLKVKPEKVLNKNKRSPLKDASSLQNKLELAEKRRSQHLESTKSKAMIDTEKIISKKQILEKQHSEKSMKSMNERVKSAETKRSSLIKENVDKWHKQTELKNKDSNLPNNQMEKINQKLQAAEKRRNEISKMTKTEVKKKVLGN